MPKAKLPTDSSESQLMPSSFSVVRETSAMRTLRLIWFGALTCIWLTTAPSSGAKRAARRRAFSAWAADCAKPDRIRLLSTDATSMVASGIIAFRLWRRPVRLWLTTTRAASSTRSCSSTA